MTSSQDHNRYTKNGKTLPKKCKINIEKATRKIDWSKNRSKIDTKRDPEFECILASIFNGFLLIWGSKMRRPAGLLGRFLGAKRPPRSHPRRLGWLLGPLWVSWGRVDFLRRLLRAIQDVLWGPLPCRKHSKIILKHLEFRCGFQCLFADFRRQGGKNCESLPPSDQ